MGDEAKNNERANKNSNSDKSSERREIERRCKKSLGHIYVSTVGWICRREKSRRKDELGEDDE